MVDRSLNSTDIPREQAMQAIPAELLGPVSLSELKESQDTPLNETRGAADSAAAFVADTNERWASPSMIVDNRLPDDKD